MLRKNGTTRIRIMFGFGYLLVGGLASQESFLQNTVWAMPQEEAADTTAYFGIRVIDEQTGRGVPLVELKTVNDVRYVTDSAGRIAFCEPELMGREVFFHVSSHGYEIPPDGFGYRGVRLKTTPGTTAQIEVKRNNIAERLYRITGQGIYRDSVLLGERSSGGGPSGGVLGQDSIQAVHDRDRILWLWGDTDRAAYPLGNFKTSGARSRFPEDVQNPADGLEFEYYVDQNGFSREMANVPGPGPVWLQGVVAVSAASQQNDKPQQNDKTPQNDGRDSSSMFKEENARSTHENDRQDSLVNEPRIIAHYSRMKNLGERLEHGLVEFSERTQRFEKIVEFPEDAMLHPRGQAFVVERAGTRYVYFATAFPFIRVEAERQAMLDPQQYEAFTCLKTGTAYQKEQSEVEYDEDGRAVWQWKPATAALAPSQEARLVEWGLLEQEDRRCQLYQRQEPLLDVEMHAGSVRWNAYRNRWVMIATERGGEKSTLGDIWYAEADALEGPWENAARIVTHDAYSFYNPNHHRFLDGAGGRYIYFEGTYTKMFSRSQQATPRYDYNQIMYRLDLDHPRLAPAK